MKYKYYLIFTIFLSCYQIPAPDKQAGEKPTNLLSTETSTSHIEKVKPRVNIEGAEITLLLQDPDIVTPTGIAVDNDDRIWVIENHTHARQDDYPGPDVDRLLIFEGYITI